MNKKAKIKRTVTLAVKYFSLMAFLISCCLMLFLTVLSRELNIAFTGENTKFAAIVTLGNIIFFALASTVVDSVRRWLTVDRPVEIILNSAEKIVRGEYDTRIPKLRGLNKSYGMNKMIECFNITAEELSGVADMQSEFIANVSHEIKTPLSVIRSHGTILKEKDLSEKDRIRSAAAVSDAADRLSHLITNILKLNKLENQQIYPDSETFNLSEQLCECLLLFENIWEEKKIEIDADIDENIQINADPKLLTLVWNNLFSNAMKFTENGGRVSVSLKEKGGKAVVTVKDDGCGIPPEAINRIFDKFYQADASHTTHGNGLGLALVKRVTDIVGGEIEVKSEVGKGSVFTVKLKNTV